MFNGVLHYHLFSTKLMFRQPQWPDIKKEDGQALPT